MVDRPDVTEQTPLLQRQYPEPASRASFGATKRATTLGYFLLFGSLILLSIVAYGIRTPLPPALSDTAAVAADGFAGQHAYDEYLSKLTEPHSVNSRGNIIVKDWLVSLAKEFQVEAAMNGIRVDVVANDSISAIFQQNWFNDNELLFAESRNVMVRIHGSKSNIEEALLINAHYDSVPTSHGVTDDGMGVAVELELLRYFVKHPPQNTIIFLFNNFEEGGLVGAKHFVKHSWFPTVKLFFNLEGAGAGGRAILFRCSSLETAQLLAKHAPLVHSTPLGNDMFKLQLLKSDTDYTILEKLGVPGLDIAFYNPRSHYHTPRDTLEYTTPEAVQHMGQMVLAAVRAVDQADGILSKEHERKMVNFDILGRIMFANGFPAVNTVNILSLVFVPLIAAVWTFFTSEKNLKTVACRAGLVLYGLTTAFVAFILSALFVIAAAAIMIKINPKVTYGNAYAVGLYMLAAAIAGVNFSQWACSLIKPVREKLSPPETNFYGVTAFWWLIVVAATALGFKQIGVLYYAIFGFLGNVLGAVLYHAISKDSKLRLPLTAITQLVIPILVLIDYTFLTMDSMRHATADGTPEAAVYALEAVTILLIALQLLPWMNYAGSRGYLVTLSVSVFVVLLAVCAVLPPFTSGWSPNKLIFRQEYNATQPLSTVTVIGAAGVPSSLYPALTDEEARTINCEPFKKYQTACHYQTDKLPLYAQNANEMDVNIVGKECKYNVCRVDVSMAAKNSLLCRVHFDAPGYSSDHIIKARVNGLETEQDTKIGSLLTYSTNYGDRIDWSVEYYNNATTHAAIGCFYDEWSKGEIPAFTHLLNNIHRDTTLLLRGQGLVFVNFAQLNL